MDRDDDGQVSFEEFRDFVLHRKVRALRLSKMYVNLSHAWFLNYFVLHRKESPKRSPQAQQLLADVSSRKRQLLPGTRRRRGATRMCCEVVVLNHA